ncbi:glycoside hydrolase family 16 protein [Myriangium duriaei CBS 260.36]|uniref:Glycoside hydrolase family 16 protein n=1 Tax=Myriangium duriaei CBS 260.36 TaxID=1168546 RepID=A0A9P4IUH3_9PEZI|nr:glycoside hydrolase family 16 protein [Myriangium duriaei CBS 260.36]
MLSISTKTLALAAISVGSQFAHAAYTLNTTIAGSSFLDHFTFFTQADPTNGFVQYVNQADATAGSLVGLRNHAHANNSVYIGVDHNTTLAAAGPGRKSVRLTGKQTFTHGLVTLDVYHAPTGCGTWPALWMVNPSGTYPGTTGEIDIYEVVNNATQNSMTLHTNQGCTITSPGATAMSGAIRTPDCWVDAPGQGNSGCSITAPSALQVSSAAVAAAGANPAIANRTYATAGTAFNKQGGGVFALDWTPDLIDVYFFPRALVPTELTVGAALNGTAKTADPAQWKAQGFLPVASFSGCSFDQHISDLALVVDTDFCGAWVDGVWGSSGCAASTGAATCSAYVAANPKAFEHAHWLIGGVEMWSKA